MLSLASPQKVMIFGIGPLTVLLLLTRIYTSSSLSSDAQLLKPLQVPALVSKSFLVNHHITTILSDVDGTILSSKLDKPPQQLSKTTFTAIARAIDNGYNFFPCTGRSRESMALAAPDILNLFGGEIENVPGVYQQGLQVYGPTGILIHEKFLDFGTIAEVVKFCDTHNVAVIAYAGGRIFCRERSFHTDKIAEYNEPLPEEYPHGLEHLGEIGIKVHKLILLDNEDVLEKKRPLLAASTLNLSLTKAVPGMLEVLPCGSSKGEGVAILLKHIGNLHIYMHMHVFVYVIPLYACIYVCYTLITPLLYLHYTLVIPLNIPLL
jgi:hydroxymethylpyrimidine pyrophosphatase-like HAD family hydrolase